MADDKKKMEWEELDLTELLKDEDDPDNPTNTFLNNYSNKKFIFHVLYVNFNLTDRLVSKLANVEGVERLMVISRYRGLFNIGKLFDTDEVKRSVQDAINMHFYPEPPKLSPDE